MNTEEESKTIIIYQPKITAACKFVSDWVSMYKEKKDEDEEVMQDIENPLKDTKFQTFLRGLILKHINKNGSIELQITLLEMLTFISPADWK